MKQHLESRIKDLDFRQASLVDVCGFLTSASFDPGSWNSKVVYAVDYPPEYDQEGPLITFSALDITFKEALDITCDISGAVASIGEREIVLRPDYLRHGMRYLRGDGVQQDYGKAMRAFKKARDSGDPWGYYYLGLMYEEGNGVPKDYGEAGKNYKEGADLGNPACETSVGVFYYKAIGTKDKRPNYAKAVTYLGRAARRNHPPAFYWLADYSLYEGRSVRAYDYLQKALTSALEQDYRWCAMNVAQKFEDLGCADLAQECYKAITEYDRQQRR